MRIRNENQLAVRANSNRINGNSCVNFGSIPMTTIEDLTKAHNKITYAALQLVIQRGDEYATKDDTLKTFREVGLEQGMPASSVAMVLLSIKYKRIIQQRSNKKPFSDSIKDLINYAVYVDVLTEEEKVMK